MDTMRILLSGLALLAIVGIGVSLIMNADTISSALRRTAGVLMVAALLAPLLSTIERCSARTGGTVFLALGLVLVVSTAWMRFRDRRAAGARRRPATSAKRRVEK